MLLAVICCWLWVCALGHDHEQLPVVADKFAAHSPVDVRYDLHAKLVPDSGYVTGMLDAALYNRSGETIGEFFMACDTALRIDSVLYQGVPIDAIAVSETPGIFRIVPLQIVPAGETTHFLFSFRTPLPKGPRSARGYEVLESWFPQLLRSSGTSDASHDHPIAAVDNRARCDIRATLEIDSAYSLVVAGELLNEKEHIGLVRAPEPGEIQIDIVGAHQTLWGGLKFRPAFPSGNKRYYVRHLNATGLPLVIGRNLVQDRLCAEGLTLDLFRSHDIGDDQAREVLQEVEPLLHSYLQLLGPPKNPSCHVVMGGGAMVRSLDPSLLVVGRFGSGDYSTVLEAVAALTRLWLGCVPEHHPYDEAAVTTVFGRYLALQYLAGSSRYHGIDPQWTDGPTGGVPDQQVANRLCAIHAAYFIVGSTDFRRAVKTWMSDSEGSDPQPVKLDSLLNEPLAHVCDSLSLAALASVTLDFGTEAASPSSWRLYNHGDLALPLEIAYATGYGDTLVDTIACDQIPSSGDVVDISLPSGKRVYTVIVDPYYRYNDRDRRNNVLQLVPTHRRHFPPLNVFPLYNTR
ncbi:MAG: hypothetical protein ABIE70_11755 [bacterium]